MPSAIVWRARDPFRRYRFARRRNTSNEEKTMRESVLVTRATFPSIVDRLRKHFDVEENPGDAIWDQPELIRRLQNRAGAIVHGSDRIDGTLLEACPQLRAVCNIGVGYNNIDVDACTLRSVLVTNTPDVLTDTTADFGFALLMATARRITESEHFIRRGDWTLTGRYDMFVGADIHGTTLGIFGMGRIGQAIARRGALGFDMRVIYHNRSRLSEAVERNLRAHYVDKDTLMRESDHLVIVVPYSKASHHAIGTRELSLMKRTATLINIARGGVVDDAALAQTLNEHRIDAAGLDVFEGEPRVHPELLRASNVVLTPHIGSASAKTRHAMASLAADNLIAALRPAAPAGAPPTPVNPEVLEAWRQRK
jgi:glyoxylate/hydroxypyruvate/2-ketogluconate reductase